MIQSPAGYQGDVRIKRYLDFYQAGYGVAMLSSGVAFSPLSLFANGEQGGWYDPSDLTTLFQDAAGTTPVTAVEQPVGRVLDKSGRGNHLSQSTAAARPVLSARVNLLTYTEEFDNAAWPLAPGSQSVTVTANAGTAPDGTLTADQLTFAAVSGSLYASRRQSVAYNATSHTIAVWLKAAAAGDVGKTVSIYINDNVLGFVAFTNHTLTASWVRVTATGTLGTSGTFNIASLSASNGGVDQASFSALVWGADLRPANSGVGLPAYQRVGAATDYDTTGFPLYLKFDGTDDFLQSSTITPGADKAQVFAGVRKLSDADAMIAELSTAIGTNAGSINLLANLGFSPNLPGVYSSGSRGSATVSPGQFASSANTYLSPVSNVLSMQADIAADTNVLRANSVNVASATGDQGTGNYLAYPIYVGARFGTTARSLFFNSHLYSLILRFSATNMDAATITATETWVNGKTLAY